jgi:hypothetical protein
MPKELGSAFIEELQTAVDQGRTVVLIPGPAKITPPPPPPRKRDEMALIAVLCLLFELRRGEGLMLAKLMACDYCTQAELHNAANCDKTIAPSTMNVLICKLRKKLAVHNIEITTLYKLGYGLRRAAREKICRRIAEYDAEFIAPAESQLAAPSKRRRRRGRVKPEPSATPVAA